tara:strand:- start:446 stop:1987 length:1542 start_codon:yes stop_codon:yes gene_type:complete
MAKLNLSSLKGSSGPKYTANIIADGQAGKLLMTDKKSISTKGSTLTYTSFSNKEVNVAFPTTGAKLMSELNKVKAGSRVTIMPQDYSFYDIDKDAIKDGRGEGDGVSEKQYPTFNRGGVSEGIYACAIFLRFTAKGKDRGEAVSEATLKRFILGSQVDAKVSQTIKGTGDNLGVNFKDDIVLKLGLKLADIKAMKDPKLWEHWKGKGVKIDGFKEIKAARHDMIGAALKYINASPGSPKDGSVKGPAYFARLMYANKVYNEVRILAEGEEAQDETKVDIRVDASNHDGEDVKDILRISLKFGGVGQFGQMAGVTWDITANVMRTWFDHEPTFTEKQYNAEIITLDHKRDAARAMRMMWENEIADITKQLKTRAGAEAFQKALYNNISQGKASKEEEAGVELIDTYKNDVVVYNLDTIMEQCFYGMELQGELFLSKARGKDDEDLCGLRISALGIAGREREDLIQIRIKRGDSTQSGPYYRTIFEKQHGLTKLLAATVREYDKQWSTSGKRPVI